MLQRERRTVTFQIIDHSLRHIENIIHVRPSLKWTIVDDLLGAIWADQRLSARLIWFSGSNYRTTHSEYWINR
jgi:hypothetical protein